MSAMEMNATQDVSSVLVLRTYLMPFSATGQTVNGQTNEDPYCKELGRQNAMKLASIPQKGRSEPSERIMIILMALVGEKIRNAVRGLPCWLLPCPARPVPWVGSRADHVTPPPNHAAGRQRHYPSSMRLATDATVSFHSTFIPFALDRSNPSPPHARPTATCGSASFPSRLPASHAAKPHA
ncbi:hypothetical protein ACLOJK_010697 [Asimina triloba]